MMILRRGRFAQPSGSGLDIETPLELGVVRGRRPDNLESWRPPIEVFECPSELVVRVEIAGLSSGDLIVMVEGDTLLIRGERVATHPIGPRLYHESRIRYGPFEATVHLPFPVSVSDASADYTDGLLRVRLPRNVAARIPVRVDAKAQHNDQGEQ